MRSPAYDAKTNTARQKKLFKKHGFLYILFVDTTITTTTTKRDNHWVLVEDRKRWCAIRILKKYTKTQKQKNAVYWSNHLIEKDEKEMKQLIIYIRIHIKKEMRCTYHITYIHMYNDIYFFCLQRDRITHTQHKCVLLIIFLFFLHLRFDFSKNHKKRGLCSKTKRANISASFTHIFSRRKKWRAFDKKVLFRFLFFILA